MNERFRLQVFFVCSAVALSCWTLADRRPRVFLGPVDLAGEQRAGSKPAGFAAEDVPFLSALSLDEYAERVTAGRVVRVKGPEWERIVQRAASAEMHHYATEAPFPEIRDQIRDQSRFVVLEGQPLHTAVVAWLIAGDGLRFAELPDAEVYRWRPLAVPAAVAGLLAYLLLPWPRRAPDALHHRRWAVVLAQVLILLFLFLPALLAGPLLLGLVAWGLRRMAFHSAFSVRAQGDRLLLTSDAGETELPFSDIAELRLAQLGPPRWLAPALGLVAIFGRSALRGSAASHALLLGRSRNQGIGFVLRDGRTRFIWFTDRLGRSAATRVEGLLAALRGAGLEPREPILERHGFAPDWLGDEASGWAKLRFVATPVIVTAAFAFVGNTLLTQREPASDAAFEAMLRGAPAQPLGPVLSGDEYDWERRYETTGWSYALRAWRSGDGLVVAGATTDAGKEHPLLWRTDARGETAVPEQLGPGDSDVVLDDATPLADGGALLLTAPRVDSGDRQRALSRIDLADRTLWQREIPGTESLVVASGAGRGFLVTPRGDEFVILSFDLKTGPPPSTDGPPPLPTDDLGLPEMPDRLRPAAAIAGVADGGVVVAGDARAQGVAVVDARLVRHRPDGSEQWRRTYGGPNRDTARAVVATADGGFVFVGLARIAGQGNDAVVVRTDASGLELWRRTIGTPQEDEGVALAEVADGGFWMIVRTTGENLLMPAFALVRLDRSGAPIWQRVVFGPSMDSEVAALVAEPDGGVVLAGTKTQALWLARVRPPSKN